MGRKSHLFYQNDIARSIARNVPVTARCGRKQTITEETWEKSREALPCRTCMNRWAASLDGSTIQNRAPGDKPPHGYLSSNLATGQTWWTNYEVGPWGA